ncbi:MAG: Long-chain-fatty-acid--CoA ligase [Syntrophorhabdaceae bacterium PtaU1.Bin034]|nr:MAG: Long-chain-fatty-acid--CoA ligase [Syntrophorhabdaceae bacterium PtaU1.Bin034]
MTIGDLLVRSANKFPNKLAIVQEDASVTFRTLNERVNGLANSLVGSGIKKGDRVGVLVHNCKEFIEIYFALAKIGVIFCPYNNHLREWELKDIIDYSTPRFVFMDADFAGMISTLKPELKSVEKYVCLQTGAATFAEDYETLVAQGSKAQPDAKVLEDDVLSIIFTAGTTGRPKGAMRTHRHLMSDAIASAIDLRVGYDERVLITFPMYHVAAEDNIVRHSFLPNTIYIKREGGFNPAEVLEYISKEHISRCQFVPTMIHSLIQVPDVSKYDLSSLRLILYAGSSMPVELLKKALAIFPCGFAQLYGQTESGPFTTVLKPEDHALEGSAVARLASSGKPALNYEIRIVDENDNDVPQGEIGEIIGRSEAMMIGYWQMPEETAKKLKNGWLHTGDLGRFDEEGFVYIVERKNDMIISGGVNVYPREIEEVLYRHPAVSEVSVIGIPDEHWGEVVKAVVVLKDGVEVTAAELIDFCGKNLAGFKKPKSVDFWKELPKSPQGKILKKEIRKHYA